MDSILALLARRFKQDTMLVGPEFFQMAAFREACDDADLKDVDQHVKSCKEEADTGTQG